MSFTQQQFFFPGLADLISDVGEKKKNDSLETN